MELALLEKYKLTPTELYITRLILLNTEVGFEQYLIRFLSISDEIKNGFRETLVSLQNKGIITKEYKIPEKGERFIPMDVTFNKNFVKTYYKASFALGKELFDVYPTFGNIGGCTVPLKGIAKKFDSLEDFYRFYGKQIGWDPIKHNHIIELVQWAKDNTNYIQMSICSFVVNNSWEDLESLKNGDLTNVNFDTVRTL